MPKNTPRNCTMPYTWEYEVCKNEWFTIEGDLYFDLQPAEPRTYHDPGCDADAQLTNITIRQIEAEDQNTGDKWVLSADEIKSMAPILFKWLAQQLLEHADMDEMKEYCFYQLEEDYEQ